MPTYDYRCEHCGHEFSRIQSFADTALEVCPKCGKRPTRLMSLPSIVFKGSGWYKTDSRGSSSESSASSGSSGTSAASDKSEKTKSESGKGDTKGDAKGDTKSETKSDTKKDKPAGSGGASTSGGSGGTST